MILTKPAMVHGLAPWTAHQVVGMEVQTIYLTTVWRWPRWRDTTLFKGLNMPDVLKSPEPPLFLGTPLCARYPTLWIQVKSLQLLFLVLFPACWYTFSSKYDMGAVILLNCGIVYCIQLDAHINCCTWSPCCGGGMSIWACKRARSIRTPVGSIIRPHQVSSCEKSLHIFREQLNINVTTTLETFLQYVQQFWPLECMEQEIV